jgi:hypothetical protein
MGLADYLLDNDWRQRTDINTALGEGGAAHYRAELALDDIAELRRVVVAQREQIAELGAVVSVLVKMFGETGAIDGAVLRRRVDAELAALAEAARPKPEPVGKQVRCTRCDRMVSATATNLTPDGTVCDRCMALGL